MSEPKVYEFWVGQMPVVLEKQGDRWVYVDNTCGEYVAEPVALEVLRLAARVETAHQVRSELEDLATLRTKQLQTADTEVVTLQARVEELEKRPFASETKVRLCPGHSADWSFTSQAPHFPCTICTLQARVEELEAAGHDFFVLGERSAEEVHAENERLRGALKMEAKRFREADTRGPHYADYWRGVAWAMATRMESELKEKP